MKVLFVYESLVVDIEQIICIKFRLKITYKKLTCHQTNKPNQNKHVLMFVYDFVYNFVCVCVCVYSRPIN